MKKVALKRDSTLTSRVEEQLGWGQVSDWSDYDFERLGEIIQSKTEVNLSVTTLKRVLGKIQYQHAPSITTLNTLAQFLGYADWRAFQREQGAESLQSESSQQPSKQQRSGIVNWKWLIPLSILSVVLMVALKEKKAIVYHPEDFSFNSNKVFTEGLPNSVVFTYDATEAKTDSVYIAQSWDISRKTLVPKDESKHSAIYYYPGYFRAKLIIGDQIVQTHDLQIASGGWLALIETEEHPVYLEKEDIVDDLGVTVNQETIERYGFALLPEAPKLRYFYQGDLGPIQNDNFTFETQVKNPFKAGTNACQYVEVLIQCKDDIIIIPLCAKGCIGQARLYAAGIEKTSQHSDLSRFGADLSEWTTLRVESKDRLMTFYVNGLEAASFTFPNDPTGIVGVQYRFNGPSSVKYAHFQVDEKLISLE